MSRSTGSVLSVGQNKVETGYATTILPDIPSEQYSMPLALPAVKQKFLIGPEPVPIGDPEKPPPLYFNQTGNTLAELFEAPIEDFNFKLAPTPTGDAPISREQLTASQTQSRYSALTQQ